MKNEKIVPCGYCKKPIHINDFGGVQKDIGFFHSECHLEAEKQALKQADVIKSVCDCTHTQACKECAESKNIDWSIIEQK